MAHRWECRRLRGCTETGQESSPDVRMQNVAGQMDIDVTLVEDSRRLAKQCKMKDLIEELENKCKQVYQFGEALL